MLSCQLHLCEQCRTIFPSLCLMLHCITSLHMYNVSLSDLWIHHWQCNLSIESGFDLGKRWCLKHLSKIDQNYVFDFAVVGKHSSLNSKPPLNMILDQKLTNGKLEIYLKPEIDVDRIGAEWLLTGSSGLPRFDRMIFDLCISWPKILVCGAESDWGVNEEGKSSYFSHRQKIVI